MVHDENGTCRADWCLQRLSDDGGWVGGGCARDCQRVTDVGLDKSKNALLPLFAPLVHPCTHVRDAIVSCSSANEGSSDQQLVFSHAHAPVVPVASLR